jgi:hypothetical protein
MAKAPDKKSTDEGERIPFDDALRQILKAPPAHKIATKKPASKGKKKAR